MFRFLVDRGTEGLLIRHLSSWGLALLCRHRRRGGKTNTSSDASEQVPERTFKDTPEEAKLHGRQCPSDASLSSVSQASLRRVPDAVPATVLHLPHAGNLALRYGFQTLEFRSDRFSNVCIPRGTPRIIAKPPRCNQARRFTLRILSAPRLPVYTGTPYSYIVSLGRSTLSFQTTHVLLESNRTLPNKPGRVFNS